MKTLQRILVHCGVIIAILFVLALVGVALNYDCDFPAGFAAGAVFWNLRCGGDWK